MPAAGFKPTIPASKRPQTHALDRAAIGIGCRWYCAKLKFATWILVFFFNAHTYACLIKEVVKFIYTITFLAGQILFGRSNEGT
jgi:hypothetical protein